MGKTLPPVIAIDGPSASGKGTVSRLVARRLGFGHLDSGALYRLAALAVTEAGIDLENESEITNIILKLNINLNSDQINLEGRDVTDAIRAEAVGTAASRIAALPGVRRVLLERQRAFRRPPGLVADGRDMGSVVFPDAVLKIFLTASAGERAVRRYKQLMEKGLSASMDALLQDIRDRDARDSERTVAPLQRSADAVAIDTTGVPVAAVVEQVLTQWQRVLQVP